MSSHAVCGSQRNAHRSAPEKQKLRTEGSVAQQGSASLVSSHVHILPLASYLMIGRS